jgi:hypothetical protein
VCRKLKKVDYHWSRPGLANLFHKWAKILIKKVKGAKFLIKNAFDGQNSAISAKIAI